MQEAISLPAYARLPADVDPADDPAGLAGRDTYLILPAFFETLLRLRKALPGAQGPGYSHICKHFETSNAFNCSSGEISQKI